MAFGDVPEILTLFKGSLTLLTVSGRVLEIPLMCLLVIPETYVSPHTCSPKNVITIYSVGGTGLPVCLPEVSKK